VLLALLVLAGGALGDEPAAPEPAAAGFGTLEVTVTGFESSAGRLAIALFANADDYETQQNAVRRAWLPITEHGSFWRIQNLPHGEYALVAYQDLNGNEQIDMRFFGLPKEPVAVSNNARGRFGPPGFEAARFEFSGTRTRHDIELR
jgi:uncharacterized protein (DUF2141 family)